jgi:hypothetical protein
VPGTYQWAEMQSTARGRGAEAPRAAQAFDHSLGSKAFIGLPCPKKMVGIRVGIFIYSSLIGSYVSQSFSAPLCSGVSVEEDISCCVSMNDIGCNRVIFT